MTFDMNSDPNLTAYEVLRDGFLMLGMLNALDGKIKISKEEIENLSAKIHESADKFGFVDDLRQFWIKRGAIAVRRIIT